MKKSKKYYVIIAALAVALSITACSKSQNEGSQSAKPQENSSGVQEQDNTSNDLNEPYQVGDGVESMQMTLGKITSIVGNQVKVAIAKMPEMDESSMTTQGEAGVVVGGEGDMFMPGDDYNGPVAQAIPDDFNMDDVEVQYFGGDGEDFKMPELEYTGEEKEFTIPVGVSIINNFGKQVMLDTLKKGNLVGLNFDKSGENLLEIVIME